MSNIKTVCVCGGGIEGTQIAIQCAINGCTVKIYGRSKESIEKAKQRLTKYQACYKEDMEAMIATGGKDKSAFCEGLHEDPKTFTEEIGKQMLAKIEKVHEVLVYSEDLKECVSDADLIIESIAENKKDKIELFTKINEFVKDTAIICTNTSSMTASMFAGSVKKPERFLAYHFCNHIWRLNMIEVMGHPQTDVKNVETMATFAKEIKMVPVVIKKETPGYLVNSLLNPWIYAAEKLWVGGVADPQTIDTAWTKGTGAPRGPFHVIDAVGLNTKCNLIKYNLSKNAPNKDMLTKILEHYQAMVDKGLYGRSSGEGFYKYDKI